MYNKDNLSVWSVQRYFAPAVAIICLAYYGTELWMITVVSLYLCAFPIFYPEVLHLEKYFRASILLQFLLIATSLVLNYLEILREWYFAAVFISLYALIFLAGMMWGKIEQRLESG